MRYQNNFSRIWFKVLITLRIDKKTSFYRSKTWYELVFLVMRKIICIGCYDRPINKLSNRFSHYADYIIEWKILFYVKRLLAVFGRSFIQQQKQDHGVGNWSYTRHNKFRSFSQLISKKFPNKLSYKSSLVGCTRVCYW